MKYFFSWAAAASAIAWSVTTVAPASAQTTAPAGAQTPLAPNPQIDIANPGYVKPANPALTSIYQQMQSNKVLEALQLFLAPLKLPAGPKLVVKFDQCGGASSVPYKHGGPVTICYEYVQKIEQMAPQSTVALVQGSVTSEAAIVGPVVQAALHEVAIAVFDVLDIPVWGRTDDAADRLSAFIMVQFGPNVAWNTIVGTAWFLSGNANVSAPDFSDIRGVVAQRYYTTLCIAYGAKVRGQNVSASGVDFSKFIETPQNMAAGNLPASRAPSCPYEYDTIKQAFVSLFLQPKLVDQALADQVKKELVCNNGQAGDPLFQFACAATQ